MNDSRALWFRKILPVAAVVLALVLAYAFNFFVALPLIVFALAIWISRALQRSRPPELGE